MSKDRTPKARMLKANPLYKVQSRGEETVYFCRQCAWTYPREHVHFDFTRQTTLNVQI